eukprot:TRINITY_DN53214_c0_g1_i1.p1 TRINITY_DN53214_c0_g1~~TRINITY_DN53214_c0_g1_i1.p1  ORF type:complete len:430 (+),score=109.78 TRINITY_DN53214_c0_g1_i1:22-1311(+)
MSLPPRTPRTAAPPEAEAAVRQLKQRGILPARQEAPAAYAVGFSGRWLVVAAGGDCLMDYAWGTCDAERELPLISLCSLSVAMAQFIVAASSAGAVDEGRTATHAVLFSSFLLALCHGTDFSVLVVVARPDASTAGSPSPLPANASLRYKAMEIHAALSEGDLGVQFKALAASSAQEREEQLGNYTLSSVLGPSCEDTAGSLEGRLHPATAAAAREVLSRALNRSYATLLGAALQRIDEDERKQVASLCIFDSKLELLQRRDCLCTRDSNRLDWQGLELMRGAGEMQQAETEAGRHVSVWVWPADLEAEASSSLAKASDIAVVCNTSWPVCCGALLRLPLNKALAAAAPCEGAKRGLAPRRLQPCPGAGHSSLEAVMCSLEEISRCLCDALKLPMHPLTTSAFEPSSPLRWDMDQRAVAEPSSGGSLLC